MIESEEEASGLPEGGDSAHGPQKEKKEKKVSKA